MISPRAEGDAIPADKKSANSLDKTIEAIKTAVERTEVYIEDYKQRGNKEEKAIPVFDCGDFKNLNQHIQTLQTTLESALGSSGAQHTEDLRLSLNTEIANWSKGTVSQESWNQAFDPIKNGLQEAIKQEENSNKKAELEKALNDVNDFQKKEFAAALEAAKRLYEATQLAVYQTYQREILGLQDAKITRLGQPLENNIAFDEHSPSIQSKLSKFVCNNYTSKGIYNINGVKVYNDEKGMKPSPPSLVNSSDWKKSYDAIIKLTILKGEVGPGGITINYDEPKDVNFDSMMFYIKTCKKYNVGIDLTKSNNLLQGISELGTDWRGRDLTEIVMKEIEALNRLATGPKQNAEALAAQNRDKDKTIPAPNKPDDSNNPAPSTITAQNNNKASTLTEDSKYEISQSQGNDSVNLRIHDEDMVNSSTQQSETSVNSATAQHIAAYDDDNELQRDVNNTAGYIDVQIDQLKETVKEYLNQAEDFALGGKQPESQLLQHANDALVDLNKEGTVSHEQKNQISNVTRELNTAQSLVIAVEELKATLEQYKNDFSIPVITRNYPIENAYNMIHQAMEDKNKDDKPFEYEKIEEVKSKLDEVLKKLPESKKSGFISEKSKQIEENYEQFLEDNPKPAAGPQHKNQ
jgi:hypothetical protein